MWDGVLLTSNQRAQLVLQLEDNYIEQSTDLFYLSRAITVIVFFNVLCELFFICKWLVFWPVGLHHCQRCLSCSYIKEQLTGYTEESNRWDCSTQGKQNSRSWITLKYSIFFCKARMSTCMLHRVSTYKLFSKNKNVFTQPFLMFSCPLRTSFSHVLMMLYMYHDSVLFSAYTLTTFASSFQA